MKKWRKISESGYFVEGFEEPIMWIDTGPAEKESGDMLGLRIQEWEWNFDQTDEALKEIINWCEEMLKEEN
jgi:hypothetical protein